MTLHQLNLDETTPAQPAPTSKVQPPVDGQRVDSHNQPAGTPAVPLKTMKKRSFASILPVVVITVLLGVGSGFLLNKVVPAGAVPGDAETPVAQVATGDVKAGDVFGSADAKAFADSVTGYLEAGGIEGEGSHRLLRAGGETQTVYLTSSVTDLSKFEQMEIKVWGETFRGQKAGWLMDVGRVEVVNPQGQKPD